MIYPAKYNGINFSYDITRESQKYNFDNQRGKAILNRDIEPRYLCFFYDSIVVPEIIEMTIESDAGSFQLSPFGSTILPDGILYRFAIHLNYPYAEDYQAILQIGSDLIYSEVFCGRSTEYLTENEICHIKAFNNDARHGYVTDVHPAFGFFKFSKFKSDIFLNKKTEYEYSYSRKKILSSENQIGKRFTFQDLTMYQQNLLKWLCNCENLSIDGIEYQLISDFTEVLSDENSEIMDLRADFVEANQSFFSKPAITRARNIFTKNFFVAPGSLIRTDPIGGNSPSTEPSDIQIINASSDVSIPVSVDCFIKEINTFVMDGTPIVNIPMLNTGDMTGYNIYPNAANIKMLAGSTIFIKVSGGSVKIQIVKYNI